MPIDVGRLRHQVTIRNASASNDGRGGQAVTWVDGDTIWADVRPTNGREFLQGAAIRNAMGYTVMTRYHSAITAKSRLYAQPAGLVLEVLEVIPDVTTQEWVQLSCVQVDS